MRLLLLDFLFLNQNRATFKNLGYYKTCKIEMSISQTFLAILFRQSSVFLCMSNLPQVYQLIDALYV